MARKGVWILVLTVLLLTITVTVALAASNMPRLRVEAHTAPYAIISATSSTSLSAAVSSSLGTNNSWSSAVKTKGAHGNCPWDNDSATSPAY